jgi:hypothetical protein
MTDEQYYHLMKRLDKIEFQTNYKGHFLIIVLLLAVLIKLTHVG